MQVVGLNNTCMARMVGVGRFRGLTVQGFECLEKGFSAY